MISEAFNILVMGALGLIYAYVIMKVMATAYFDTKQQYIDRFIANLEKGEDNGSFDALD